VLPGAGRPDLLRPRGALRKIALRRRIVTENGSRYSYGPVPSRRLGRSLGINNIGAKVCTYSCVYCQAGRTAKMRRDRRFFFAPRDILRDVRERLARAEEASGRCDFLTFVPDGEPTLDVNLGREIAMLKTLGVPVGVITNGSLLWREDVREELGGADWVSVKVDSVREEIWRRIDRPHGALRLSRILDGLCAFAAAFGGRLVTETMLVGGLNDGRECVEELVRFLSGLRLHGAYLGIPTRPPAEAWVRGPDGETLERTRRIFENGAVPVECLTGYEGDDFAVTGDVERDLAGIVAVHPMREEAVAVFLSRAGASWEVVDRLLARGDLVKTKYEGHVFYGCSVPRRPAGTDKDRSP